MLFGVEWQRLDKCWVGGDGLGRQIVLYTLIPSDGSEICVRVVMTVSAPMIAEAGALAHINDEITLIVVVRLALVNNLERLLSSLDARKRHSPKRRSHAVRPIDLTQLHATHNQATDNLPRPLHNRILGSAHVQAAHTTKLLDLLHADETLDAEGAEGTVVAGRADDEGRVDGVGVHAGLVVVVHADEGPVGDYAGDADGVGVG